MSAGLDEVVATIRACRICRDAPIGEPLPHEPRPVLQVAASARILITGQAPGTRAHASCRPFTDSSGDRLRNWIGLSREQFYDASRVAIVPMGFCFPGQDSQGGDLPPRRECAKTWRARLLAELPEVRLMLLIGTYAQVWHLGSDAKDAMTGTVRAWRGHLSRQSPTIALPHPSWRNNAWIKRNGWFEAELLPIVRERVASLID